MDVVVAAALAAIIVVVGAWILSHQVTERLDVIHDLVNSNLTKARGDLKIALERIEKLETLLTSGRRE